MYREILYTSILYYIFIYREREGISLRETGISFELLNENRLANMASRAADGVLSDAKSYRPHQSILICGTTVRKHTSYILIAHHGVSVTIRNYSALKRKLPLRVIYITAYRKRVESVNYYRLV